MDLGLGNLTELKTHLLNEALRSSTAYDATIAAIGRGVAARFERHCNRAFARVEDDTFECAADRAHLVLPRYPIEQITKIEVRDSLATGWVDQGTVADIVENILASAGLVTFGEPLADSRSRLRLTYDGGYWYAPAAARTVQRGTIALASGDGSASLTFPAAFTALPGVAVSLVGPVDGVVLGVTVNDLTLTGCTFALSSEVPASGYSLAWVAADAGEDFFQDVQCGNAAVTLAAESKAITFGTAFAAAPVVVCTLVGPEGAVIVSAIPTVVTTAGFTAVFGAAVPASGYSLSWVASAADATTTADAMPVGATARPADLFLAWMLQCQLVWQSLDPLGTGMADAKVRNTAQQALSELKLAPDVTALLYGHMRHSLL